MAVVAIPFFTDQCVPDSVGNFLMSAGHQVTRLREVMLTTTADPVIAVACSRHGQVLVSHDNDFRQVAKRLNITQRQYRSTLHRVQLCCPEPNGAERLREAMALIESEWLLVTPNRPMVIDVHDHAFRIYR